MKYKVGDKVKVRSDLVVKQRYSGENGAGDTFVEEMKRYLGKEVTISSNTADINENKYEIDGCTYNWTDEMFEGLASEPTRIKAYELMAKAAAEPEKYEGKKYKVVEGSALICNVGERNYRTCTVIGGMICEDLYFLSVFPSTILEEIKPEPKPVPFMEAVKAYHSNKTVYAQYLESSERHIYSRRNKGIGMTEENGDAVSATEILDWNWYIKEDE